MIKINYKNPEELESPDDIAQFNIRISDKYKKADYLEISCISWLKIDSKRDYQDLEQLLRYLGVDSHVIAQPVSSIPSGVELNYPNKNEITEPLEYVAKITCKSIEDSIQDILSIHSTYEENFECLKKTGCFMTIKQNKSDSNDNDFNDDNSNDDNSNDDEQKKIANTKGVDDVKKLLECRLKLDFTFFKPMESVNFIIEDLVSKYGKKPEQIVCGEISGNKVFALMLNGEIASPIGWMEKNLKKDSIQLEEFEIDYELVDFRNIKIEK